MSKVIVNGPTMSGLEERINLLAKELTQAVGTIRGLSLLVSVLQEKVGLSDGEILQIIKKKVIASADAVAARKAGTSGTDSNNP